MGSAGRNRDNDSLFLTLPISCLTRSPGLTFLLALLLDHRVEMAGIPRPEEIGVSFIRRRDQAKKLLNLIRCSHKVSWNFRLGHEGGMPLRENSLRQHQ